MFKDSTLIEKIEDADNARSHAWYNLLSQIDKGYNDPENIWYDPSLNTSDWASMNIPGYWDNTKLEIKMV